MADLSQLQATDVTRLIGSDALGNETNPVSASAAGDLSVSDGLMSGGVNGALTLTTAGTTYEAKVGASRLANRKSLTIHSFDNTIYWGYSSGVTVASGTPLVKGRFMEISIDATDPAFTIYLVSAVSGATVRISESG